MHRNLLISRMCKGHGRVLCACVLLVVASTAVAAQQTATLQGSVQDGTGHPLAGVTVKLLLNSQLQTAQTDGQGAFRFSVPAASGYSLGAEKAGSGEAHFSGISLSAGETKTIDLKLQAQKASSGLEFYDEPQFTVAGVTDSSAPGGHGSDAVLRTSEAFAKDVASLNKDSRQSTSVTEETALRKMAASDPGNFAANARLGAFLVQYGRSQEAIPYLESASKIKSDDYENDYQLALAYAATGQNEKARDGARDLLRREDRAQVHHVLADVQEKLGEYLKAAAEYQQAAESEPSETNMFDWGAELLLHRAIQPALQVYGRGARLFPQSPRMLLGLGVSQYSAGSYDRAAQSVCRASDLNPSDPTPYLFLGKMLTVETGESEAISERLGRFLKLQPTSALANYYYALSLWKRRKGPQEAATLAQVESLLKESVRLDPKLGIGYLQLGILYSDRRDFPRAIVAYQQAIESSPQLEEPHFRLAQVYRQTGEQSKAQEEIRLYDEISKRTAESVDRERRELPRFVYTLRNQSAQ
jgi:tetratricopeptide (TPR) repeat protein